MNAWKVKLSLFLNYFVIAILLNSVGIVILQVINDYGIAKESASILEAYKDLSIAGFSFVIASFIPRIGYKKSMLLALFLMTGICIVMPLTGGFGMTKVLFATIGVSFALIKVSAYSTVGLVTEGTNEHASFMSLLEGVFMVGVLSGYWLFSYFIDARSLGWTDTYWVLAVISALAFLLLFFTSLDESAVHVDEPSSVRDFIDMLALLRIPLILVFIIAAFFYVFIEQSIGTWLPTFNNKVLQLPEAMSVQVSSILIATTALGRLTSGWVMKRVNWFYVLVTSLAVAAVLVLLVLPLTHGVEPGSVTSWFNAPIAAFIFPLIGFCLAPIYPTLNSTVLSKLPKVKQGPMTGLIVIFSALGGTTGSLITGFIFGRFSGQNAFYFSLLPITALFLLLFPYRRLLKTFKYPENWHAHETT